MTRSFAVAVAVLLGAVAAAAGAQPDVDQARRELDRLEAEARAKAAADRAQEAREEAERLEARARAEDGDARDRALAAEYERRRSKNEAQAQAAQSEADLRRLAAEQRLRGAEDGARRAAERRPAGPVTLEPPLQPSTTAPRRRGPSPSTADGAVPVIAMKEAVTLCQRERGDRWRCTGPLRVAYGDIRASRTAAVDACGAAPLRDLGTVRGFRAFGCGFGINPRSSAPGNRDVPALFGVEVPGRISFRCPASLSAGCRSR